MELKENFTLLQSLRRGLLSEFSTHDAVLATKSIREGSTLATTRSILTSLTSGQTANISLNRNALELAKAYKASPNLRRAVNLISYSLAATPWVLRKKRTVRGRKGQTPFNVRMSINAEYRQKMLHSASTDYEYVYDHPFLTFLSTGSPALPGMAGLKASFAYRELKGEYFWLLMRQSKNAPPTGWTVIPVHWVEEIPAPRNNFKYKIKLNGNIQFFDTSDVFWSRDPDLEDPYGRGAGVGETLGDELDTDESAALIMRQTLSNKGFMDMLIAVSNANDATIREIDARYNSEHRGPLSTGKALVFDAERIDVKPITHPLSELKLLELRTFEKNLITSVYGIPAELLGEVENRTRATILGAERTFAKFTLLPRLEAQRLDLQSQLLPLWDPDGEYLLDYISPLPEDEERRLDVMKIQPQAFTYNEWRAEINLAAQAWGTARGVPFSVVEVDSAKNELKRANEDSKKPAPAEGGDEDEPKAPTPPVAIDVTSTSDNR